MTGLRKLMATAEEALGALDVAALDELGDGELDGVITALAQLRARVDRLWVQAGAVAEQRHLYRRHDQQDTASWLAAVGGARPGVARRDLELGAALAAAPAVAEAAARNGLSLAKTAELAEPASLPEAVVDGLAAGAAELSVDQVAAAVRQARLDHDVVDPPVGPSCEVIRSQDRVQVRAVVGLVDGEVLEVALDAYAEAAELSKDLPYAQRRARALVGLARHYLDYGDDLPTTALVDPTCLPSSASRPRGAPWRARPAGLWGGHHRRRGTTAGPRRQHHSSHHPRPLRGARSRPHHAGRLTTLAKAVIAHDRHCRYVGCTSPPWACEIHHRQPWAQGGRTTLANLGLLCWHHHHLVHDRTDQLTDTSDHRWQLVPIGRAP